VHVRISNDYDHPYETYEMAMSAWEIESAAACIRTSKIFSEFLKVFIIFLVTKKGNLRKVLLTSIFSFSGISFFVRKFRIDRRKKMLKIFFFHSLEKSFFLNFEFRFVPAQTEIMLID
jgi:hypothetical protein